jgi:hypothetical protein
LTLLKTIAPESFSWSIARTNSVTEAAASQSGSVANAENREARSEAMRAKASFVMVARATATSGFSTWVPGVVSEMICRSMPAAARTSSRYAMSL